MEFIINDSECCGVLLSFLDGKLQDALLFPISVVFFGEEVEGR